MTRRIPYAVANYDEIVRENYHFVDKTRFIRELELYKIPVFLRPRRFGKSLWCSILECYYDVNQADRFEELFGSTDIGRKPTGLQNSSLVLRFDFSTVKLEDKIENLEARFNEVCSLSFEDFLSRYGEVSRFKGSIDPQKSASTTLGQILQKVKSSGAPSVMIIVDEYDNFTNQLLTTRQDQLYGDLTTGDSFLRTFYKTIKAGVGEGSVARVFITGVLPVTMDDLTSGFNIGQIITLKEHTLHTMGFTQEELERYLDEIFADNNWVDPVLRRQVGDDLRIHYNGYRFLPDTETLYNSTICNYYLNDLVIAKGKIPRDRMDQNLKVDINWLRRLGGDQATRELVDQLLSRGECSADLDQVVSQFNREKFLDPNFFPMSLFFLGLLSFDDEFTLRFPNLTVKTLFLEYFNDVNDIKVSSGYTDMCRAFLKDHDFASLFAGYWDRYLGQVPAQAFDKMNENFFRTTFYEICKRYLSGHLSFFIEANRRRGRSDFEAWGRTGSAFEGQAWVIEFKHFSAAEAKKQGVFEWREPRVEDVNQARRYAEDLEEAHPEFQAQCLVVYTLSSREFRCFHVKR
jgi:hypothetical protein